MIKREIKKERKKEMECNFMHCNEFLLVFGDDHW